MKQAIITVFFALIFGIGYGQNGTINIEQDPRITTLLKAYKSVNSDTDYYTIQVGFGSYSRAENLKSQIDIDFPGYYTKIIFDSPTYRVHLGRFETKLEAERKFLEVRQKYPESLLLKPEKTTR